MANQASRVHLDQVNQQEATARSILEQAGYHGWYDALLSVSHLDYDNDVSILIQWW